MAKLQCWEVKSCGRTEPCPESQQKSCPAANDASYDGLNGGRNGGRICWAISGTLCRGEVQGSFAQKRLSCVSCAFFKRVKEEEGKNFTMFKPGEYYEM